MNISNEPVVLTMNMWIPAGNIWILAMNMWTKCVIMLADYLVLPPQIEHMLSALEIVMATDTLLRIIKKRLGNVIPWSGQLASRKVPHRMTWPNPEYVLYASHLSYLAVYLSLISQHNGSANTLSHQEDQNSQLSQMHPGNSALL